MNIAGLSGSPSAKSRSAWLLQLAQARLAGGARDGAAMIALRELPAEPLLRADTRDAAVRAAIERIARADVLLVATPIYKAAYSGLLKVFLDLLPPDALRGKSVLPLATGGSPGHLLAIDYALKPVLGALGARHIVDAVYVLDDQLVPHETLSYVPDDAVVERLDRALRGLSEPLPRRRAASVAAPSIDSPTLVARFHC
jgi:FMN reductase